MLYSRGDICGLHLNSNSLSNNSIKPTHNHNPRCCNYTWYDHGGYNHHNYRRHCDPRYNHKNDHQTCTTHHCSHNNYNSFNYTSDHHLQTHPPPTDSGPDLHTPTLLLGSDGDQLQLGLCSDEGDLHRSVL